MTELRPRTWFFAVLTFAMMAGLGLAFDNEQFTGFVSSVDVEGRKIVVTPKDDKEKNVDVTVNDQTTMTTKDGRVVPLKELKAGDGVGIVHTNGVASKIQVALKPAELTGHVKSVGANLKTFVVTETGTDTDFTVAVSSETSITSTVGKKLEVKELKKGDGVGISHFNSVASKVLVSVKPIN